MYEDLVGVRVRISVAVYDGKKMVPCLHEGVLHEVEGTTIHLVKVNDFLVQEDKLPDTSINTASIFFNWLQPLK